LLFGLFLVLNDLLPAFKALPHHDEIGFRLVLKALIQVESLREKKSCHTGTMFPILRKAKRSGTL
jgi:hypothetical protein